jgi:cell division protein FtsI/penicillin-binding protein 2
VKEIIQTKRGDIFDRNGIKLTDTIMKTSIYANPKMIKNTEKTIDTLSKYVEFYFGRSKENIIKKINEKDSNFIWIARQVDDKTIKKLRELKLQGIGFIKEPKRYYPYKQIASHLIGFCGIDVQGLYGIEYLYENYLKGIPYIKTYYRTISNKPIPWSIKINKDEKGRNIITTIDFKLQKEVEEILDSSIKKHSWKKGCAIVFEPKTGEILALSIRPNFDPNNFLKYPKEIWEKPIIYEKFEVINRKTKHLQLEDLFKKIINYKTDIDKLSPEENYISPSTEYFTPTQIFKVISILANRGKYIEPTLVKEVRDSKWRIIKNFKPKQIKELSEEFTTKITNILLGINIENIAKYEELFFEKNMYSVNKEKYKEVKLYSYMRLTKSKKPEYAIIFIIEHPSSADNIAREIISQIKEIR